MKSFQLNLLYIKVITPEQVTGWWVFTGSFTKSIFHLKFLLIRFTDPRQIISRDCKETTAADNFENLRLKVMRSKLATVSKIATKICMSGWV